MRLQRDSGIRSVFLAGVYGALTSAFIQIADAKTPRTEHYVYDCVRILYANKGEGAVDLTDGDQNGVPDRVEDVAKQVWAARHLFCEVLKFPDPFESDRYPGVTCIQVSLQGRDEMPQGNGLAFSSAQRAKSIPEGKPTDRALILAVGTHVNPITNGTPAHETFHLIQYGATYFKNSWFLEGQTRWSEHGLAKEGLGEVKYSPNGPWPQKRQQLQQLAEMKYDAEHVLWNPIAAKTDRDGLLSDEVLGEKLTALRYSDGSPVLQDRLLQGTDIMREILIELGKQDDVAFEELKYEMWTGENQSAPENNPYIYKAVMDVLREHSSTVGRYVVPKIE